MNLLIIKLVVLSGCEKGLGTIQGNEGEFGLQRASKIAGAKYLIMSLWQVLDKQTSLLKTTFYKKWELIHIIGQGLCWLSRTDHELFATFMEN